MLDTLRFGIVGDTRPATEDDTAGYPAEVIGRIWSDLDLEVPQVPFAVTTGDYVFARPFGHEAEAQLDRYLAARGAYRGLVFPAMGNHECTGATASNCGREGGGAETENYRVFMDRMMAPLGRSVPYYAFRIDGAAGDWSAKFVVVAANAWSDAQAAWLDAAMSEPTTYTFVVRHEGARAETAPGVRPSEAIIARHPYTLVLAGHTHTVRYSPSRRELIVGNGGAPLTGGGTYGYVVATAQPGGGVRFEAHDHATRAVVRRFAVAPDGTPLAAL